MLYDYWGGGSAAQIMANLRDHAPYHFTPFVEVRTIQDIRRAIRMLALVSDCVVLLWKGVIESGMAIARAPFDYVCGGAGYTTRHDRFGATAVSFQNEWAPVLTLNRLGYRMSLAKPSARDGENRERFVAKEGTPFGNWLHLPGRHVTVPAARRF